MSKFKIGDVLLDEYKCCEVKILGIFDHDGVTYYSLWISSGSNYPAIFEQSELANFSIKPKYTKGDIYTDGNAIYVCEDAIGSVIRLGYGPGSSTYWSALSYGSMDFYERKNGKPFKKIDSALLVPDTLSRLISALS